MDHGETEKLQHMGIYGINREAFKIITMSWRKIFSKIILSLTLPLSFIVLAEFLINEALFATKTNYNKHKLEEAVHQTPTGTSNYSTSSSNHPISNRIINYIHEVSSAKSITYLIITSLYYILLIIFYFLSTSAIVYTISCIYSSSKKITYKKVVVKIVPKVWKRLVITFLCNFFVMTVYHLLTNQLLNLFDVITVRAMLHEAAPAYQPLFVVALLVIIMVAYLMGYVYLSAICSLACVMSVFELDDDEDKIWGVKAMMKSKNLIKGNIRMASVVFVEGQSCYTAMLVVFKVLVIRGGQYYSMGLVGRVILGIICFLLVSILLLYGLVIQTLIYLVCKSSHHRKTIDMSHRADHRILVAIEDQYKFL